MESGRRGAARVLSEAAGRARYPRGLVRDLVCRAKDAAADGLGSRARVLWLGTQTAEERAAESRRAAEAEGRVLEIPESPPSPSPRRPFSLATFVAETNNRHPANITLPPVPTFMGRGTARRPVEAPAPAPSYGAMVGNQGAPEPRPVDEDADGGVFADY